ncbi:MAG: tRNA (guanosine(37)-N1)-methyltransferase TrmD [Rhabdochlamydiaceae bacterium]
MKVDILSLFPDYFKGPFDVSIVKKAREKGILEINLIDIRSFALKQGKGKHSKVDDRPYGGGPGMVLMPEPVCAAIRSVKQEESYVVYLSPQGKKLNAKTCEELAKKKHLILLCGHYEGVDERILQKEVDEEISIGDYVLTNGCLAAIVVLDATVRFIPGVLGHEEAASQDSFQEGIFDAPHYTRPEVFEEMAIPAVLKTGNHAKIAKWRRETAREKTKRVRPEILK